MGQGNRRSGATAVADGLQRPAAACPACVAAAPFLLEIDGAPALCGVSWAGPADARRSPVGPLALHACEACAHVFNAAFEPELLVYDERYDNTLHHSPTFRSYAHALAARLDAAYALGGKHVVELGCGKGEFLEELCALSGCTATGFDPSYEGDRVANQLGDSRPVFVREFMTAENAPRFDFFISRHVLEHLEDPALLLRSVRGASDGRTVRGYLEVPNAMYDFERSGWDCIYPHVSYFSATSLRRLLEREGFELLRLDTSFEGQFLAADVALGAATSNLRSPVEDLERERATVHAFPQRYREAVTRWRRFVEEHDARRVALWGAGARGVAFLNAVDPQGALGAVVDLNPAKWHRYLPLAGHQVVPPDELRGAGISIVILTNPNYVREVTAQLGDLSVEAEVVCA